VRALAILLFSLTAFSSFAVTIQECKKLYKVNSLSCSTKHWDRIARVSRKEVLLEFQLLRENRVKALLKTIAAKKDTFTSGGFYMMIDWNH
jgi:hypothetical protein